MKKNCFLRQTKIKLLDGKTYCFRALPFNQSTIGIVEAVLDDTVPEVEKLKALVLAVEKSLSYDQDAETVAYVMDNGLIPLTAKGEHAETHKQVMNALVAGLTG